MQINRKQKRQIALTIAILLVLYGILDGIFKFNIDEKTVKNVSTVLMIVAFALVFSGNRRKADEAKPDESKADLSRADQPEPENKR